ncbi:MAG: hypothetical protein IKT68_02165 [Clostridia bacterium]|nr:hypothetical protein [Clostridia bacterium]
MKKLSFLVALLLACMILSATVSAEQMVVLNATTTPAQPGGTVTLTVSYADGIGCSAADLRVSYDTNVLEYQEGSLVLGDLLDGYMVADNHQKGVFLISFAGDILMDQPGELFSITFLVDASAQGEYPIYVYPASAYDYDMNPLTAETVTATVTVSGQAVSDTKVEPVILQDEQGNTHVVQATPEPQGPRDNPDLVYDPSSDGADTVAPSKPQVTTPTQADETDNHSYTWLYPWVFGGFGALIVIIAVVWVWIRRKGNKASVEVDEQTTETLSEEEQQ